MENIARSEKIIAMIIVRLEPNGVVQSNLHSSMFQIEGEFDSKLFHDAIRWLKNEGILYYETGNLMTNSFTGVVLSSKGYDALNRPFFDDNQNTTLDVAKQIAASDDNSYWKVGDLIGGFFGGFTKSVGS